MIFYLLHLLFILNQMIFHLHEAQSLISFNETRFSIPALLLGDGQFSTKSLENYTREMMHYTSKVAGVFYVSFEIKAECVYLNKAVIHA